MKIRLEEYCRGARVRLSVDDAPMTALHALVNHFVMACTEVEEKQKAESLVGSSLSSADIISRAVQEFTGITKVDPSEYADGIYTTPAGTAIRVEQPAYAVNMTQSLAAAEEKELEAVAASLAQPEEAPKRRGRPPKKVEPAPEPAATEAQEEPGLPFEPSPTPVQDTPAPTEAVGASETSTDTAGPAETAQTTDAEITDSELQRYCAKLAQHFGTPQTVFDLAGKFVPEGAVARPTNIRDNSQRWAFVRAAEEQSGVRYHG